MSQSIELMAAFDSLAGSASGADGADRRYILLDVFTDTPLAGNQLAVFPDARGIEAAQMQQLARELKLSETAFALPAQGDGDLAVRIFTPATELPFAGHPVLGTAILAGRALDRDDVTLETGLGPVRVLLERRRDRMTSGWMQQPIPSWKPYERRQELLSALGLERSGLPVEVYENGPSHVYVELDNERAVAALAPDLTALTKLGAIGASCFAGSGKRWKTRAFFPALGVPEDPATGSAAGPLAVHLSRHGRIAFGDQIEIRQGDEIARPSLLLARAAGSQARIERVEVGGTGVIVARGEFILD